MHKPSFSQKMVGCMCTTDRRLIALLRDNARLPVATLAHFLKVSRGTVQNRIDRLTAERLKPEAEPQRVRAITMVAVDGALAYGEALSSPVGGDIPVGQRAGRLSERCPAALPTGCPQGRKSSIPYKDTSARKHRSVER